MNNNEQKAFTSRLYRIREIKLNKFFLNFLFIIAILFLTLINLFSFKEFNILLESNRWVIHTYEVIQSIDSAMSSLTQIDSSQRGFLITNNTNFLIEVDDSKINLKEKLISLSELVQDNPQQAKRISRLSKLVDQRLALLTQVATIKKNELLQTNEGLVLFNHSNEIAGQIKSLGEEVKSVELTLLQERNTAMTQGMSSTTNFLLMGSIFSSLLLIIPFIMANLELINRKIVEHKIKNTKSYLRQIIESTNDMIGAIDNKNNFQIFNEAYLEEFKLLFNKTLSVGMSVQEAFSEVPEANKSISETWIDSLQFNSALKILELEGYQKKSIYELSSCPIKDDQNTIKGRVHTVRDVTIRLEAHASLQESHQKLEKGMSELQAKNQQINLLVDMSDIMLASSSQEELGVIMSKFANQLLNFSSGYLYIMHPSKNYLDLATRWGEPTAQQNVFSPEQCWALRLGRAHYMNNQKKELVCDHIHVDQKSDYSKMCVPLMAQNDIYGLLYIEVSIKEFTLNEDLKLIITAFSELTALALANIRLRENLRYQSIRDPLTGLYNRRYLEDALFKQIHQAERSSLNLSLVMLDLDHFKKINDTYGHDAGDAVLKELGDILNKMVRAGDVACRYGGEEFILLFHSMDADNAKKRAEEIRHSVSKIQVKYGAQHIGPITISIGVALYPEDAHEPAALTDCADKALYFAKKHGRNQVALFSEIKNAT